MIDIGVVIITRYHRILLNVINESLWWSIKIDCMLSLCGSFRKITFTKDVLELLPSTNDVREFL
jgi:hypothetical protein